MNYMVLIAVEPEAWERADDAEETVRNRLAVYHRDTAELIPHYRRQGLLCEAPGVGDVEQVYAGLARALGNG